MAYYSPKKDIKESVFKTLRKIYPLFLITFCLSVPISIKLDSLENVVNSIPKALCNLLLLNAWIPKESYYFSFDAVSWYLSLVIFFAFCSPLIVKTVKRMSIKILASFMLAIIVFEFAWALILNNNIHSHYLIYICPLIRLQDFLLDY